MFLKLKPRICRWYYFVCSQWATMQVLINSQSYLLLKQQFCSYSVSYKERPPMYSQPGGLFVKNVKSEGVSEKTHAKRSSPQPPVPANGIGTTLSCLVSAWFVRNREKHRMCTIEPSFSTTLMYLTTCSIKVNIEAKLWHQECNWLKENQCRWPTSPDLFSGSLPSRTMQT